MSDGSVASGYRHTVEREGEREEGNVGVKLPRQSLLFRLCNGALFITKATSNLAYYELG